MILGAIDIYMLRRVEWYAARMLALTPCCARGDRELGLCVCKKIPGVPYRVHGEACGVGCV